MKSFIHKNLFLENNHGRELYHEIAKDLPIIDYHCHLPPSEVADDINFRNLTHIWLDGDHYKWRAMRACGVPESHITGDASDREKFLKWAETVPKTIGNPLYHWTHMELADPFGIGDRLLNQETAESIWGECNERLADSDFSTRELIKKNRVEVVATTDDPADELNHHKAFQKEEKTGFKLVPTFRPDRGMEIEDTEAFQYWIEKLESVSGISINGFQSLIDALEKRHDDFHELGCRASDHGIPEPYAEPFFKPQLERITKDALAGQEVMERDARIFKSAFLYHCGRMNREKGWVFQLHIGPIRNNNSRMMKKLGRDTGFDSIGDAEIAEALSQMLDRLDRDDSLPKTVLYNSNPRDNELFITMAGNFMDGSVPGKVQHGPPWWFLDQKDGIEEHLTSHSNLGVLSEFIGMTTDSRSFLSYSRHDYFRRVLCNFIGADMEKGLIPDDMDLVSELIEKVCYRNAKSFFNY